MILYTVNWPQPNGEPYLVDICESEKVAQNTCDILNLAYPKGSELRCFIKEITTDDISNIPCIVTTHNIYPDPDPYKAVAKLVSVRLSRDEVRPCVKEVGDNITVTSACVIGGGTLERSKENAEEFERISNKIALQRYRIFSKRKEECNHK